MNAQRFKSLFSLLIAALLVGAAVYGIALLVGYSATKAGSLALIAMAVGLLEKPILWVLRRFDLVGKGR